MNIKKYIKKMAEYLDVDRKKCSDERKCLKKVLKKLTQREKMLTKMLDLEQNEQKQKEIEDEIVILHAKRKKGLKAMKELCKTIKPS